MELLSLANWIRDAMGGSMALAVPVAVAAGLASFFSPCVIPLLPGYLSYATGLGAAAVIEGGHRRRMLAGSSLFVAGFAVVFVATGVAMGTLGAALLTHQRLISVVVGALTVVLGLVFADVLPLGRRELRLHRVPAFGVVSAPLLGIVFGVGWTPCIGPALSVVLTLALNEGSAVRGGVLAAFYALGLGVPFVLAGLAYTRLAGTVGWVRRHQRALQRLSGLVMVAVGVLLITGWWDTLMAGVRSWAARFETVV